MAQQQSGHDYACHLPTLSLLPCSLSALVLPWLVTLPVSSPPQLPLSLAAACRYISPSVLPDSAIPANVKYLAGWGYLLSIDLVEHAVKKVNLWQRHPDQAPAWFA